MGAFSGQRRRVGNQRVAFLNEAVGAFPFKITHVFTDRGSCFTTDGFEEACRKLQVQHRKPNPFPVAIILLCVAGTASTTSAIAIWLK